MSIIDDVIRREKGYRNDPSDPGGRTQDGISERSNPEAWADGKVTPEETRAIYEAKYLRGPGFDKLTTYPLLQALLVDYGVNSGPALAIQKLQAILGVSVDGRLGPATVATILSRPERQLVNLLVAARIQMFAALVVKRPAQLRELKGWVNRALEFLIA